MPLKYLKHLLLRLLFPCILLLLGIEAKGQVLPLWEESVIKLFNPEDSIHWAKKYIGSKNNLFTFQMYLASNGEIIKGWYHYDGSTDTFHLDGMQQDQVMVLNERYGEGREYGYFKGDFDGDRFQGTWVGSDIIESMTCNFENHQNPEELLIHPEFLSFKIDHPLWASRWLVYTDYTSWFQGVMVTEEKQFYQIKLIDITENQEGIPIYHVLLLDTYFRPALKLRLNLENKTGEILVNDWESFSLKADKVLLKSVLQQDADFHQLKMVYRLPDLDKQSSQLLIFGDTSCNLYERKKYEPHQRASIYSTATFYPTYADKNFVSAVFSVNTARVGENCMEQKTINWYEKAKGLIDLTFDIADKPTWDKELDQFIAEHLQHVKSEKENDPIWQQLTREDFKHLLISDAGIVVAKDYDPILGVLMIPVPKEMVLYHFDRKSLVYKITNAKI